MGRSTEQLGTLDRARLAGSLALLACLSLAPTDTARGQQPIALGSEFLVNHYTTNGQTAPVVALSASGDFVVVWQSYYQDGLFSGVFGQRFTSAGALVGLEFQVSLSTIGDQVFPSVAVDGNGDFVVVWQSDEPGAGGSGVFGRRFSSVGAPQGAEFQVNSYTSSYQTQPDVAMNESGAFVVAWQSNGQDGSAYGVFGRRFSITGVPLASEFRANSYTMFAQQRPAVALDDDGDVVVTWESVGGQDSSSTGVFAQRFDSTGMPVSGEFQVNAYVTNAQTYPEVGVDHDGDFVVVWQSYTQEGSDYGIFGRRFSSAGSPIAAEFQVNGFTANGQRLPTVTIDDGGDFLVAWRSSLQDGSSDGVFARAFIATGTAQGGEFQVNTRTADSQAFPTASMDASGDFVVAWQSANQDGSLQGVFAQQYRNPVPLDIDGNGIVDPLTDGLLLLRFLFGFTEDTLISGAVGAGCTRCIAKAIEPRLAVGALKQGVKAVGAEFQVNAYTFQRQFGHGIAASGDGRFVVAWEGEYQDGGLDTAILARRFDAEGVPQANELVVNTYTVNAQFNADFGMDDSGDFVVVWTSFVQDGSTAGLFGQRFAANGLAQASEFKINSYTAGDQGVARVALDANGDFVVVWQSPHDGSILGIFGRRWSSSGSPIGGEFQVNTLTSGYQATPAVAMDAAGDFVVAWASNGQDGSMGGVFARRFDAAGVAQGVEFQVNSHTPSYQRFPAVAMDASGDFVIAWQSFGQESILREGIFARRFNAAGVAQATEFQINSYTPDNQKAPTVGMSDGGDFVVAWHSTYQDGSYYGVFARRWNAAGTPQAAEFQVNSYTIDTQTYAVVGVDSDGDFVIAWNSKGQDGSSYGLFAQRFQSPALFDVDGDGETEPLIDGLLALRFLFGFTGSTLINGAVGQDCTRCTAPQIEAYLQTLL